MSFKKRDENENEENADSDSDGEIDNEPRKQKLLDTWRLSTKIQQVMRMLIGILRDPEREHVKVVVFSQFTSFLDILECALREKGVDFGRLDGSMRPKVRQQQLDAFETDPDVRVFLVSLGAGGVGLNLTVASVAILCDIWWNPQVENQAFDRVHRIGQKYPVTIYRLIVQVQLYTIMPDH